MNTETPKLTLELLRRAMERAAEGQEENEARINAALDRMMALQMNRPGNRHLRRMVKLADRKAAKIERRRR